MYCTDTLGKLVAECIKLVAECFRHSATKPNPVVKPMNEVICFFFSEFMECRITVVGTMVHVKKGSVANSYLFNVFNKVVRK